MNCLQCGAPLDQDFGIVACTQCGAVMMIDMDGLPQLAHETETPASSEPTTVQDLHFDSSLADPEPTHIVATEEIPAAPTDLPELANPFEAGAENPVAFAQEEIATRVAEAPAYEPEPAVEPEAEPVPEAPVENNDSWFDQGLNTETPAPEALAEAPVDPRLATGDFSDVEDFGNQDVDESALQFDLTLSGMDHGELRSEVLSVLADPRLFLNVRDLQDQITNGTLTLSSLSAARTSLIVSRLRHLKLGIQWRQKVYGL